jgi:hypothetical protein
VPGYAGVMSDFTAPEAGWYTADPEKGWRKLTAAEIAIRPALGVRVPLAALGLTRSARAVTARTTSASTG